MFESRWQFICYFGECLKYEKRDAVATSGLNFRILANATDTEKIEHEIENQQETYLQNVETRAVIHPSSYTQFRAKVVGTFSKKLAYNLLVSIISVRKKDMVFEINMTKNVELTEHFKRLLLAQANAVGGYKGVDELEVSV